MDDQATAQAAAQQAAANNELFTDRKRPGRQSKAEKALRDQVAVFDRDVEVMLIEYKAIGDKIALMQAVRAQLAAALARIDEDA